MSKWLRTTNESIFKTHIHKNLGVNEPTKELNNNVGDDLIKKLESIESEMSNGKSVKFKDVDELAERYGV